MVEWPPQELTSRMTGDTHVMAVGISHVIRSLSLRHVLLLRRLASSTLIGGLCLKVMQQSASLRYSFVVAPESMNA
jgi:hypothetical protein